ncbi:hypothetical protein BDP81DRAFT_506508 [Colletotrichum phormii]|uniref:Uncharacterized protein n=1 Tax=Colletotrichum phormii TaxID=359342 RepID=A0AAJ0E8L7_9PEZI|nr:uncharacterized protein BDP81DRAFT_506508 [Colletotrichum phormii]KAK1622994.1 hypothetical protein BDP81DRAFT_506508 [Colletotrichum phormii]
MSLNRQYLSKRDPSTVAFPPQRQPCGSPRGSEHVLEGLDPWEPLSTSGTSGGATLAQAQVAQPPLIIPVITPFSPQSTQTRPPLWCWLRLRLAHLPLPVLSSAAPATNLPKPTNTYCHRDRERYRKKERKKEREENQTFPPTGAAFESADVKYIPIPSHYDHSHLYISIQPRTNPDRTLPYLTHYFNHDTDTIKGDDGAPRPRDFPPSFTSASSERCRTPLATSHRAISLSLSAVKPFAISRAKDENRRRKHLDDFHKTQTTTPPPPPADESPGAQPPAKPASSLNTNARARLRQTALELRALYQFHPTTTPLRTSRNPFL